MKTLCFILICLGAVCLTVLGIFSIAYYDFMNPGGDDE